MIDFDSVYDYVAKYNGIMIPAHLDKKTTSLLSNLGFIPPNSKFNCAEMKHTTSFDELKKQHDYLEKCMIISNSDAHYLQDIREPVNFLECEERNISSVFKYLKNK